MALYKILLSSKAEKNLLKLPKEIGQRIAIQLKALQHVPIPRNAIKLKGTELYRVRVGDYRIVYEIRGNELLILVVAIGHRRDVYKSH